MKARQILDAVHGYVIVPPNLDQVLDSPPVQRLRGICQTALLSQVYPGANGTRFEHSIGVMHLAYITFLVTWDNSEAEPRDAITQEVSADVPHYLDFGKAGVQLAECVAAVGLVFTTGIGSAVEPRNFHRAFVDRCHRAGVPVTTVHATRKACASLLVALDVHPRVVMQVLRHSKIDVTMDIYSQVTSEATTAALRKLGSQFNVD